MKAVARSLCFCCCFFATWAQAQNWYDIEVIIFEHLEKEDAETAESGEIFNNKIDLVWPSPLLQLQASDEWQVVENVPSPFVQKPKKMLNLKNESYVFRVSKEYRLLWHQSWAAPLLDEDQAPWIEVQASKKTGDHSRLQGAVRVYLSRYLHFQSNLWLTELGQAVVEDEFSEASFQFGSSSLTSNASNASRTRLGNSVSGFDQASIVPDQFEFDWAQLPKKTSTTWGCNFLTENWPEDDRLLPANYYDNPAPDSWYYPFGCGKDKELAEGDETGRPTETPIYFAAIPQSLDVDAEISRRFPEYEQPVSDTLFDFNQASVVKRPFAEPLSEKHPAFAISRVISIKDKRRLKSKELHYIDHPKIGIMVMINPIKQPKANLLGQ